MFDPTQNLRLIADVVEIAKDTKGHIGIAIGGGAPSCPCLYIVQIFENSPAKRNGLIGLGDEIVAVNGGSVKGFEKSAVALMIKETEGGPIKFSINRLHFDSDKVAPTLDILMKKFKHRFIDSIDDATANVLGLSRAILCNDILSKLQDRLEANQQFYTVLIRKAEDMAKCYQSIAETQVGIGGIFSEIGTHGTEEDSESFSGLAGAHKQLASQHTGMGLRLEEMINALRCHAEAAIPDVRQTLAKYLDAKLARESLPRMHSGNYEYRAMLKCRENCRTSFMDKRKQVAVKIELLDERHVRELALQLKNLINGMSQMQSKCHEELAKISH